MTAPICGEFAARTVTASVLFGIAAALAAAGPPVPEAAAQSTTNKNTFAHGSFSVVHQFALTLPVPPGKDPKLSATPSTTPLTTITAMRVFFAAAGCRDNPYETATNAARVQKRWLSIVPTSNSNGEKWPLFCTPAKVSAEDEIEIDGQVLKKESKAVKGTLTWSNTITASYYDAYRGHTTTASATSDIVVTEFTRSATSLRVVGELRSLGESGDGIGSYSFAHAALVIRGGPELQEAVLEWKPNLSVTGGALGTVWDPVSLQVLDKTGKVVRREQLFQSKLTVKGGAAKVRWQPDGSFEADADEVDLDVGMPSSVLKNKGSLGLSLRKGAVTRRTLGGALGAATLPVAGSKSASSRVTGKIPPVAASYKLPAVAADHQVVLTLGGGGD